MAEYVAVPPNVKLQVHGTIVEEWLSLPKTPYLPAKRGFCYGGQKSSQLSSWKTVRPQLKILNGSTRQKTARCCCLSDLANVDSAVAATSGWVPVIDQVLLLASITLSYMAGIVPHDKSPFNAQTNLPLSDMVPDSSSSLGSSVTNGDGVSLQFAWDVVRGKLTDSLSSIRDGVDLSESTRKFEQNLAKQPSSLFAVSEGPRLRLLWRSFQSLKKEVANISVNSAGTSTNDYLAVFAEIIQNCCRPLCMAWLEEEVHLVSKNPDKELLSLAEKKLDGYDSTIQQIRKSGKEGLYAELVYFLKFDSSRTVRAGLIRMLGQTPHCMSTFVHADRKGGFYSSSLFIRHGVAILEDLLITLADGIASMYLELISVDSSLTNEMNNLGLSLCTLSTRSLQRLRNEVALNQWFHQNMAAVASMYEDRFDLSILECQLIESRSDENENFGWLKKIGFMRSGSISSSPRYVSISSISIPVKRTKELRALVGWRYYFSLFLELADITMPIIKKLVAKVSDAISFFLVCLIGRSLGLIYSGIRNSLRLK